MWKLNLFLDLSFSLPPFSSKLKGVSWDAHNKAIWWHFTAGSHRNNDPEIWSWKLNLRLSRPTLLWLNPRLAPNSISIYIVINFSPPLSRWLNTLMPNKPKQFAAQLILQVQKKKRNQGGKLIKSDSTRSSEKKEVKQTLLGSDLWSLRIGD